MAQSGKDAILAAARRIAELDSDDDDTADDGDWANWGGIDWKNLDVDDEAEEHAARETSAESEARTAEALGIPIRLARWLARHKGGDVRRAFHVATRNRSTGAPTPDADGTIALGNRRPKYVPLEERVVAVKPAAMPTKRTDDFETLRRAKEARERTEARRREVAAGCARAIAEEQKKENVAMTPVARAAVAQALVSRDQRPDLAPGAGPAGRHEPSAVGARRPVDAASAVGANVSAVMSLMGVSAAAGADGRAAGTPRSAGDRPARRLTGAERAAADNALLRLLPPGERPLVTNITAAGAGPRANPSTIPKPTRQQTLDGFAAAALRAEARTRFDGADPDATWIRAHPKAVRRAMTRAVDAESRVASRAGSKATYRNLSAQALRVVDVGDAPDRDGDGGGDVAGVTGGGEWNRNDAVDPADRDAVAFANDVARAGSRRIGVDGRGSTPVGLAGPKPGALLQGYRRPAADAVRLADARVVRGDAAVAFFTVAARLARPVLRLCDRARGMLERRRAAAKRGAGEEPLGGAAGKRARLTETTEGGKAAVVDEGVIPGRPRVVAAVRAFVDAYMEPLVDVGAVQAPAARTIARKATAKVMAKHERAKDAAPILARESDAIKKLVKAYVRRGQKEGGRGGNEPPVREAKGGQGGFRWDDDVW
jgi:hypothetical protein